TTEGGPKGIVDLSFSPSRFGQGHPKTRGPKCHSSLPSSLSPTSARPSPGHHDTATFFSRSTRSTFPPSLIRPLPFPFLPLQDTSATSTSTSSRNTSLSNTNRTTSININSSPVVASGTSDFSPSFTPTARSPPLSSTRVISTEPSVTRTKTVVITSQATTTVLSPIVVVTIMETTHLTTMLPPTTYTETILIQSTETEATTIIQTKTATSTTVTHSSTDAQPDFRKNSVSMLFVVGGISGIVLVILDLIVLLVLLCRCLYRRRKTRGASDFLEIPPSSVTLPPRSHESPCSSTSMVSVRSRDDPYPRTIRHDGTTSQVSMMPNGDLPMGPSEAEYRHSNNTFAGPLDMEGLYGFSRQGADSREVNTPPSRFSDPTVSSGQLDTTKKRSLWSVFRIKGFERRKSTASNC
ncbi:hypothetical protein DFS33DRAFT_1307112, partial [Desarmillaria ectypa]